MTLQRTETPLFAVAAPRCPSLWLRLLRTMKENQQRRADQVLRDYPPVASCERREGFARHVERWFVGR